MTAGTSGFGTVLIIANPIAGQIDDMLVADLTHRCRTQVAAVELHRTSARGDARQAAAQAVRAGTDLVLAVGGDGTVREVVQGLLDSGNATDGPSLMIVPAGTGNSSYLAQWGNLDWREAVTAALTGQGARRVLLDLAQLEELDQLVLLGACSGLIAEALVAARTIGVTGRERYRIALAQAAADFISYPGKVLVDGVVVHEGMTVLANVGGGKHRGGRYQVLPRSILDDGLLDVCVIDDAMPAVEVPALIQAGDHLDLPGVHYARGERITVLRSDGRPISVEHDGEWCSGDLTGFTLRVLPRALPVLCRAGQPGFTARAGEDVWQVASGRTATASQVPAGS